MCPTLVTRGGEPVFAVGGAGGTRIPNGLYEVLAHHVGLGATMEQAMQAPRLDTNGTLNLGLERKHPPEDETFFRSLGYNVTRVTSAYLSAVTFDRRTRETRGVASGGG